MTRDAWRYFSLEALDAERRDDLPTSHAEGLMPNLPMSGVGADGGRVRASAVGPYAP